MTKMSDLFGDVGSDSRIDILLKRFEKIEQQNRIILEIYKSSLSSSLNKLYTPKEVSELLNVHYHTVLEWLREGKLQPFEGCKHKIRGWDVLAYIQGKQRFKEAAERFGFLGLCNGQSSAE